MTKDEFFDQASKKFGIPKEDISGIYIDEEKLETSIFHRKQLVNQLQRECLKISESFDNVYKAELDLLSSELSETMPIFSIGHIQAMKVNDELSITCANLLRNASTTLISSIQTLRSGFRLQSGLQLRSVIEICALVINIYQEDKTFKCFLKDKHKSTDSIAYAEKQIPLFGKAWGLLSNKQIHINTIHADWYPLRIYTDKEEIPVEVTLGIIGIASVILQVTTELVFYENVDKHNYWNRIDDNKFKFVISKEELLDWVESKLNKDLSRNISNSNKKNV